MAKCKLCKKPINDGTEYCDDCAEKKDLKSNESYLDNLLNSVQNKSTTAASHIYKKKKEDQTNDSPDIVVADRVDDEPFIDPDDLEDYNQFDILSEFDDPIVISDEELYGDDGAISEVFIEDEQEDSSDITTNIDNESLGMNDSYEQEYRDQINGDEQEESSDTTTNIDNEFLDMIDSYEQDFREDEHIEPILDDLLQHLDMSDDNDSSEPIPIADSDEEADNRPEEEISPENELLELLNHFNPDNPVENDLQTISDLLGGISTDNQPAEDYPEDVGEVFSEALEAMSDLQDSDHGINYIEPDSSKKKKKSKDKKKKTAGLIDKLFADIDDEEEEKKAQEEAAAAKSEKKKKKKAKGKKEQAVDKYEDGEGASRRGQDEEPEDKKKKKPKKEKKKKIEILDEEVDVGHINKTGASVVFLFFGVLVMLLLISTNIFSYSLSIKNATDYFGRQRYTQAYNEVYGIELKDEDIELYDKIMTVMFVNKQLNSYNNYYHMRKFPEALDSLLKGLQRYDKYIELATILGINTDLEYVRDQILAELYSVFSLTEEQAINIINSESQAKYSIAVYDVILQNISFYSK